MEQPNGGVGDNAGAPDRQGEAIDFVRFCHRRKHVGWPELYDEMCAVAGRGLYRGYGPEELAEIGIGFGLFQMPGLAVLVARVLSDEAERRRRTEESVRARVVLAANGRSAEEAPSVEIVGAVPGSLPEEDGRTLEPNERRVAPVERSASEPAPIRLALAAGA
jgi:hypothetical protein